MSVSNKITELRKSKKLSIDKLVKLSGVPKGTLSKISAGITTNPNLDTMKAIAKALSCTLDDLSDNPENDIMDVDNIVPIETKKIPLLGTVAAGEPIFADEDFSYYVECGTEIKADFALKVKGDSMVNARIHDGDIVFVRKQKTVNQGEIAVVLIDDEATLKRFRQYGNLVVLQSENPAFHDIEIELSEDVNIEILGKAVAFQSDVR
jgi:repressor LexA